MASQIRPRPMPPRCKKVERNIALSRRKSLRQKQQRKAFSMPEMRRKVVSGALAASGLEKKRWFQKLVRPRKRMKPVSDKRREINKDYERAKREWWAERLKIDGGRCQFVYANGARCKKKSGKRPHHVKRRGRYLCDKSTFLAVDCPLRHHDWIHSHPEQAAERGMLVREHAKH